MAHKMAHKMVLESCKRSSEGLLVLGIPLGYFSAILPEFRAGNTGMSIYIVRDRGKSVIEGAYIHIFGFTNRENNQFQNKSMRQNLNI